MSVESSASVSVSSGMSSYTENVYYVGKADISAS